MRYARAQHHAGERVAQTQEVRAIQLKTSAYVLPDEPTHNERFQWLAKQIRDDGGEATLIRAKEIEGLPHEKVVQLFNNERAKDYEQLAASLKKFIERNKKRRVEARDVGVWKNRNAAFRRSRRLITSIAPPHMTR